MRLSRALINMLVWLRRLVLAVGWGGVLVSLAALAGLWWLTATPGGVQWAVAQAERHLEALTVEEVAGTPWRGMRINGLAWSPEQGASLRLETGRLRIDPGELWRSRLRIPELSVDGMVVDLGPANGSDQADRPAERPVVPAIAVDLERVVAERVVIRQGEARYAVDQAHLSAQLEARGQPPRLAAQVQALDLRLPEALRVNGSGDLAVDLEGAMPLAARLDLLVDHPRGWLSGSITAGGSWQEGVTIAPRLAWIGTDGIPAAVCGRLRLTDSQLDLKGMQIDALGGRLDLRGQASWVSDWSIDLAGQARSLDPAWVTPSLPGALDFDLDAQLTASAGWLPASGRLMLSGMQGVLAGESIADVSLELRSDATRATAKATGTVAGGRLDFDGHLTPERDFAAAWQIDALPLAVTGEEGGTIRLASQARLDGRLPDWRAALSADDWIMTSRLVLDDGRLRLTEYRDGREGRSAEMHLAGQLDQGHLTVERLALDAPGGGLSASGELALSPDWTRSRIEAVEAALSIPDLAGLPWDRLARLPGVDAAALHADAARGTINASLQAAGPLLAPHGRLELQGSGMQLAGYALDRAEANLRLDPPPNEQSSLSERSLRLAVEAHRLQSVAAGTSLFEQLTVEADGRQRQHRWAVDLQAQTDAHLEAHGGWQGGAWQGRIAELTLDSPWVGAWRLPRVAELQLSPSSQRIDGLCLEPVDTAAGMTDPGSICLDAGRGEGHMQAGLQGDLALETLWRQWQGGERADVSWAGRLRLNGQADLGPAGRTAQLSLLLPASELYIDTPDATEEEPEVVAYPETRLSARLVDERVEATLSGGVADWMRVDGRGRLDLADDSLEGRLSLGQTDLGSLFSLADRLIGPLAVPVSELTGTLAGQLVLAGRLDDPRLAGELTGQGLGFTSLPTGTAYRDGRVEVRIDPQGQLAFAGSLLGEADTPPKPVFEGRHVTETAMPPSRGRLRLEGSGQVNGPDDWQVNAALDGEAVPLLRLPSLALDARPELEGRFTPSGGRLSGTIHVPLAIANIARLPQSARGNSEDLVIVGQEPEPQQGGYPLSGDINIVLGDAVSLRGQGLATRLTGGIEMRLRPQQPVGAFGEIRLVDGRYEAYGQSLTVERGRLIFAGPLTSPGLDVVAIRQIQDEAGTEAGLQVVGPLESPEVEVFSRPPTSPSDALSLLLTGRRLSAGSDADASLLLNAIAGLGIRQGDELAQQVRSMFGVDELGFTTAGGAEGARLSVGKRIGENLLVRYAVGVFDGVGEVITRYRINKFLHLELTSSAQSQSADLIYQIDRGRPEN